MQRKFFFFKIKTNFLKIISLICNIKKDNLLFAKKNNVFFY